MDSKARVDLRILHVIPSVAISDGGPSFAMAAIERASSDAGIVTTTLTTDHGASVEAGGNRGMTGSDHGARRVYVPKWLSFYKVAPGMVPYLLKHVRTYDVVHIHALFSFAPVVAALIARMRGVPYVVRPLGTLSRYGVGKRRQWLKRISIGLIERPILRHAAVIHFTSQSECDEARSLGFDCSRGIVIPLGIEDPTIAAGDQVDVRPERGARRIVLFLSRLDPKKNVEALVDAYANSEVLRRTSTLLIAGDGNADYVAVLKHRAAIGGLADHITWLGHVAGAEKAATFASADVFVLPSYSENFGIAAAEAMLAGLPCILSNGVAIASDAEAAGAAVSAAPDAAAFANAMTELLDDPVRCRLMGQRARAFAVASYSTATMAERLMALYRSILKSKGTVREQQR